VDDIKNNIKEVFDIRELGQADKFLGMKIIRDQRQGLLKLSQEHMADQHNISTHMQQFSTSTQQQPHTAAN
jgi:hypothetical protein